VWSVQLNVECGIWNVEFGIVLVTAGNSLVTPKTRTTSGFIAVWLPATQDSKKRVEKKR
jgi:hypothetical protein